MKRYYTCGKSLAGSEQGTRGREKKRYDTEQHSSITASQHPKIEAEYCHHFFDRVELGSIGAS